jgi:hypothetical protein
VSGLAAAQVADLPYHRLPDGAVRVGRVVLNAPLTTQRVQPVRGGLRKAQPYLELEPRFLKAC